MAKTINGPRWSENSETVSNALSVVSTTSQVLAYQSNALLVMMMSFLNSKIHTPSTIHVVRVCMLAAPLGKVKGGLSRCISILEQVKEETK
jgi:hypothetical protein